MDRLFAPILLRGVLIGAVAAASTVAGCGRKGPLESPPSAQVAQPAKTSETRKPPPVTTREGYPVAPPGEKKPILLDRLID